MNNFIFVIIVIVIVILISIQFTLNLILKELREIKQRVGSRGSDPMATNVKNIKEVNRDNSNE